MRSDPPLAHHGHHCRQSPADLGVGVPVGNEQDDAGTQDLTVRTGRTPANAFEFFSDLSCEVTIAGQGPGIASSATTRQ